jgi:hypothetical protein
VRACRAMDDGDIERFEEEREMELYREYRDVLPMFAYVIETERRFYLANKVEMMPLDEGWVQVHLTDAWVWDMFRPARFVSSVQVMTRRARAAELADAIEQRLGDARADPVVPPAFQDDDVLQVEVDPTVADHASHPDERAVGVPGEHGRE